MLRTYVTRALITSMGWSCPENGSKMKTRCEGINDKDDIMNVLLCKKLGRNKKIKEHNFKIYF